MKIEIDLNDILGDENGAESLNESVRRQAVEQLSRTIKDGIGKRIDAEIAQLLNEQIQLAIKDRMQGIVDDVMTAEYTSVDRYGNRGEKTNFRGELVKAINGEMVYQKKNYNSDKNVFSKAVDEVIDSNMTAFKTEFGKHVDAGFIKEAMEYATAKLAERLGVKK